MEMKKWKKWAKVAGLCYCLMVPIGGSIGTIYVLADVFSVREWLLLSLIGVPVGSAMLAGLLAFVWWLVGKLDAAARAD